MRSFSAIAINACLEIIRQPVYLILMTCTAAFIVFLSSIYYFGLGDDPKLVENSVLATMLLAGLFGAVLSASTSIASEVRSGTALAVLSKPVDRIVFLLAKLAGIAAALTIMTYINVVAALLSSRISFDAYGSPDMFALGVFYGAIALAFLMGGFTNFFLRRPFVSDTVWFLVIFVTIAFIIVNSFSEHLRSWREWSSVDWRVIPAGVLILFALWLLASLAVACSTVFELIPTLAICSGIFLIGLMSNYFFGDPAEEGRWWGVLFHTVLPNWQIYWVGDILNSGKSVPFVYLLQVLGYTIGYMGAVMGLAVILFENRELTG